MSYHYDVAIVITYEVNKEFQPLLQKAIANPATTSWIDPEPVKESERSVLYYADYTRWDKTEAGIKQIHDFLDNLDEDDYFYILIGENIGDEESQGNPELRDEWGLFPVWGLDTTGFKWTRTPSRR